jgi:hypothetical protein
MSNLWGRDRVVVQLEKNTLRIGTDDAALPGFSKGRLTNGASSCGGSKTVNQPKARVLHESFCGHASCIRWVPFLGSCSGANHRLAPMERAKCRWRGR